MESKLKRIWQFVKGLFFITSGMMLIVTGLFYFPEIVYGCDKAIKTSPNPGLTAAFPAIWLLFLVIWAGMLGYKGYKEMRA